MLYNLCCFIGGILVVPDIEPPVFREKKGKKQTARRKGEFEVPAPKDTSRMGTIT